MNAKEKLIKQYPLTKKMDCNLDCYCVESKRYILFLDITVNKENVEDILKEIEYDTNNSNFSEWKTIIAVGSTNDFWKKEELFYFNEPTHTFVVFFLLDKDKSYMNDSWIFVLGNNYNKHVRKINKILFE